MNNLFPRKIKDYVSHISRHNILSLSRIDKVRHLDTLPETQLKEMKQQGAKKPINYAAEHSKFYKKLL